jgi:adenylate kinase family enzyme
VFIVGPDGSGKSSAARFLAMELGFPMAETGDVLVNELARVYAAGDDNREHWARTIHGCKDEFRGELQVIGDLMTRLKPACLIDACCRKARIIVGVRRVKEMAAYATNGDSEGLPSVWIKLVRVPERTRGSRYELGRLRCDYEVLNAGNLSKLQETLRRIAAEVRSRAKAA